MNKENKPDLKAVEVNDDDKKPVEKKEPVDPIEELTTHNTKLKNEYLYLRAEFDNFRKNSIKERSDLIKYGPERMANGLLDVLDIFEKALESEIDSENLESFVSGIKMTSSELNSTLERFGVKAIDSMGKVFDPNIHEALGSEEHSEITPGHITQVFKKPYMFHDKVMRHGQVIVAKAPETKTEDETQTDDSDDDVEIVAFE